MSKRYGLARPLILIALLAIIVSVLGGCFASSPSQVTPPPTDVTVAVATPTMAATLELTPEPTVIDSPTPGPTPFPTVWLPSGSPLPPITAPEPTAPAQQPTPQPTDEPLIPVATGNSPPTRVVIPALGIDLPVIKSNPLYPKCNVAQYLSNFVNPGQPGSTYIYAHARTGMFLPLLTQSEINNGAAMIGMLVKLYTRDLKLHLYRINIVKRHATDFTLATNLAPGEHRLILQTSEGPHGTIPKLQIAAKPIGVYEATAAEALPTPHPVTCG